MTINAIPQPLDRAITLAQTAYIGALDVGLVIGLTHNDAPTILLRLRAVIGTPPALPGGVAIPGTLAIYDEAVNTVIVANALAPDLGAPPSTGPA